MTVMCSVLDMLHGHILQSTVHPTACRSQICLPALSHKEMRLQGFTKVPSLDKICLCWGSLMPLCIFSRFTNFVFVHALGEQGRS